MGFLGSRVPNRREKLETFIHFLMQWFPYLRLGPLARHEVKPI